jgi:hypothetical protein
MTTTKGEAHALAARVAKVPGWKVSKPRSLSGAYKITPPNGNEVVQVHLTPSDPNWMSVVMRALNRAGFEADEAKAREAADKLKARELESQRAAAEKKAAELAAHATAIQKARGPYAMPETVPWDWFATHHPAPWFRWVLITPELAARMVDKECGLNTDNRPLRPKTVAHYKAVILSGQWHLTHQGMAIDQRGVLQDGQHRLHAIAESGVTVPAAFFVGMPPENFKAIDEGLLRRAADLIAKDGGSYSALSASVMRLVDAYDSADPRRAYHAKYTNESVYDLFQLDADNMRESVRFGSSHYKKPKMNATGLAAAHYMLRKINGAENVYVEAFFNGLITGVKGDTRMILDDEDPRQKLRELFINWREKGRRINALDNAALIVQTWNYVVLNERPRFIRFADNMEIPRPLACADNGLNASQCPQALTLEVLALHRWRDSFNRKERVEAMAG